MLTAQRLSTSWPEKTARQANPVAAPLPQRRPSCFENGDASTA
jgi:hypothetical protein